MGFSLRRQFRTHKKVAVFLLVAGIICFLLYGVKKPSRSINKVKGRNRESGGSTTISETELPDPVVFEKTDETKEPNSIISELEPGGRLLDSLTENVPPPAKSQHVVVEDLPGLHINNNKFDSTLDEKLSRGEEKDLNSENDLKIGRAGMPIEDFGLPAEAVNELREYVENGGIPRKNERIESLLRIRNQKQSVSHNILPCSNVHVFYYPWYSNPKVDGHYSHWNHKVLPHWDMNINKNFLKTVHEPPDDIGSDFFPKLGPYSSRDPLVIKDHFSQIAGAKIGVIVVSYYPPGAADDNGRPWDDVYHMLLDMAVDYGIKVTFHIEPYKNRNEVTVRDDIVHIIDNYGKHKGFYQYKVNERVEVPLFYVYDSYLTKPEAWANVLKLDGPKTIRGTKYDSMIIGLMVDLPHSSYTSIGGFDGLYTYFASNGFTYGSTRSNWKDIAARSQEMNFLYIPSVGPGYIDTNIRPWNAENTRDRSTGEYYKNSWRSALEVSPKIVSITSFNEWHEGTQIEKAIPKTSKSRTYLDYNPYRDDFYLKLTKDFVLQLPSCKKRN